MSAGNYDLFLYRYDTELSSFPDTATAIDYGISQSSLSVPPNSSTVSVAVGDDVGAYVGERVGVGVGGGVGGALSSVGIQLMPQADMHDTACCMHGEACGEVSNHSLHASLGPCC